MGGGLPQSWIIPPLDRVMRPSKRSVVAWGSRAVYIASPSAVRFKRSRQIKSVKGNFSQGQIVQVLLIRESRRRYVQGGDPDTT
jgi:hypothetical protein